MTSHLITFLFAFFSAHFQVKERLLAASVHATTLGVYLILLKLSSVPMHDMIYSLNGWENKIYRKKTKQNKTKQIDTNKDRLS